MMLRLLAPTMPVAAVGERPISPLRFGALGDGGDTDHLGVVIINPLVETVSTFMASHIKPVAFASSTLAIAQKLASLVPGSWATSDYEQVVQSTEIDAVYVCLPNGLHYEWTMRALRAGKHVLCEKALAANAEEARRMVELAHAKHLVLMEALAYVHHPLLDLMHASLASGTIGEVEHIDAHLIMDDRRYNKRGFNYDGAMAGGVMADVGVYVLSVMYVALGAWPKVDRAHGCVWAKDARVDEEMSGAVTFPHSPVRGTFRVSMRSTKRGGGNTLTVRGARGTLTFDTFFMPHKGTLRVASTVTSGAQASNFTSRVHQLLAFSRLVRARSSTSETGGQRDHGSTTVGEMTSTGRGPLHLAEALDQVYAAAGMLDHRVGPSGLQPSSSIPRASQSVENCTNWPIMTAGSPVRLPHEIPPANLSSTQVGRAALPLQPLRFGALGTSYITERVLTQQAALKIMTHHAKVVAIAGRTLENAQRIAARVPGAWATSSYEAVVLSPEVDAVYIALPNGLHYEWVMMALRAGKHVLCEKSLAINAEEARRMVEFAASKRLVLMEGSAYAHHPLIPALVDIIASGVIGQVTKIHSQFLYHRTFLHEQGARYDGSLGGGVAADLGSYVYGMLRVVGGSWPMVTHATGCTWANDSHIDEELSGSVSFKGSSVVGTFRMSFIMPRKNDQGALLTVTGSRGTLTFRQFFSPQVGVISVGGNITSGPQLSKLASYAHQMMAFSRMARAANASSSPTANGGPDLGEMMSTGQGSLELARLMDEAYAAAGISHVGPSGVQPSKVPPSSPSAPACERI
jgi:predicted dehydrogenase